MDGLYRNNTTQMIQYDTVAEFMLRLETENTFSNLYFLIRTTLRTELD